MRFSEPADPGGLSLHVPPPALQRVCALAVCTRRAYIFAQVDLMMCACMHITRCPCHVCNTVHVVRF